MEHQSVDAPVALDGLVFLRLPEDGTEETLSGVEDLSVYLYSVDVGEEPVHL
jgi:hypothetical protein